MKLLSFVLMCVLSFNVFAVNFDDFIEENLIEPVRFFAYENNGFAVFDRGDQKLKVFDKDFKKLFELTLKKGQGPGQLKNGYFASVVFWGDKVIVVPGFEDKILVFSKNGKFLKDVRFEKTIFSACKIKGQLYLFSNSIDFEKDKTEVAYKANLETGKIEKTIEVTGMKREQSELSKKLNGITVSGISVKVSTTDDGNILLLDTQGGRLITVDLTGKVLQIVNLPAKQIMQMKKVEKDGKVMISMHADTNFLNMRTFDGNVYITAASNIGDDEKVSTKIFKVSNGKVSTIVNSKGLLVIMKINDNKLYLFNDTEYQIKEIKL